MKKFIPTK